MDTPDKSDAAQVNLTTPNKGIGQTQTSLQYALTGWQDMHALLPALERVGLYYSVIYENLQGPKKRGARQNDLSYDLSIAKTWTDPNTPIVGNLTTFLEAFATTDLDGTVKVGVDFPMSHPHPFREVFRFTYILNF